MSANTALRNLADGILADARMSGIYFGDRKVFLGSIPGVDVADPKRRQLFDDLRRAGLLEFARADLVAAMDPDLVARSEWSQGGATNHFLVVA
jgi:hypothetical protein